MIKNKLLVIGWFCTFMYVPIMGQDYKLISDSLNYQLSLNPEPSEKRLNILLDMVRALRRYKNEGMETYIAEGHSLAKTLGNDKMLAYFHDHMATLYYSKGDYSRSFKYLDSLYTVADMLQDDTLKVQALISFGSYFHERKDYYKSIEYGLKALELNKGVSESNEPKIYYNLSLCYGFLNILDTALNYCQKGIEVSKRLNSENNLGLNYSAKVMVLHKMGRDQEALEAGKSGMYFLQKVNNYSQLMGLVNSLGVIYANNMKFTEAIRHFEQALALAKNTRWVDSEATFYSNLSILYSNLQDFEKAYYYADSCLILKDSIADREKIRITNELENKFELERINQSILLLEKENLLKENILLQQRQLIAGLILLVGLSLVLGVILIRNSRLRKRNYQLLKVEKDLEHAKLFELEMFNQKLQKENAVAQLESLKTQVNPHFLFNSLNSLASLIQNDPNKAEKFVEELSFVYRYLLKSNDSLLCKLSDEVEFLKAYTSLLLTRFGKGLKVSYEIPQEYLTLELPTLTLQLLIENAIKHNVVSDDQPLHILLSITNEGWLSVKNNLQRKSTQIISNKIGLNNISSKYSLFGEHPPKVIETDSYFEVIIPLINSNSHEHINR